MTDKPDESVFQVVQRLVQPIAVIATMMQAGDTDQARHYELAKIVLAMLTSLGEDVSQSLADADNSEETREKFLTEIAHIIYSLQDYLSASANAIYNRKSNSEAMDIYADGNATALFVTRNQLAYAVNHELTVRTFFEKVNLMVVKQAAGNMSAAQVKDLINALYEGVTA